jgi:hypothetical protein
MHGEPSRQLPPYATARKVRTTEEFESSMRLGEIALPEAWRQGKEGEMEFNKQQLG